MSRSPTVIISPSLAHDFRTIVRARIVHFKKAFPVTSAKLPQNFFLQIQPVRAITYAKLSGHGHASEMDDNWLFFPLLVFCNKFIISGRIEGRARLPETQSV